MDKRNIVIGLLATIAVLLLIVGAAVMDTSTSIVRLESRIDHLDEEVDETATNVKKLLSRASSAGMEKMAPSKAKAEVAVSEYDFGKITKGGGKVSTTFALTNTGKDALTVGDIVTSCGCTSATIDKTSVPAGERATVTVTFDPNFHEEPQGRFSRSVFIPTNDPNNQEIELKISVEIIG
ncbi:DUF1573 domain-containing protein [Candidatus Azambacteria bacterium]|nr:DUF1573 domain-containing protein [Candidatus Azambacteria bacterium]